MNKKAIIVTTALLLSCMTGCGGKSSSSSDTEEAATVTSAASETTETSSETETSEATSETEEISSETATATTVETETQTVGEITTETVIDISTEDGAPTAYEAKEIMEALNTVDKLGGCAVPFDEASVYTSENGTVYYKVAGSGFTSTADIRTFMEKYLSPELIADRYSSIIGGDSPLYIDAEGALYMQNNARGGGFSFKDTEPVIKSEADGKYSIIADYDDYGAVSTLEIAVSKHADGWKIDFLTF